MKVQGKVQFESAHPFNWPLFPHQCTWKNNAPSRIATLFGWAAFGNILMVDKLRKRHSSIGIVLYVQAKWKNINHLLLNCELVRSLWVAIFSTFWLEWFMYYKRADWMACWQAPCSGHKFKSLEDGLSMLDVLHLERTQCPYFWKLSEEGDGTKAIMFNNLYSRTKAHNSPQVFNLLDLKDLLFFTLLLVVSIF